MQDLDPSDICKKKFLNPLKRIRVIIRTPTHRRTDGRTDRQTDRRTDEQGESSIPPLNFVAGGIIIIKLNKSINKKMNIQGKACSFQNELLYISLSIFLRIPHLWHMCMLPSVPVCRVCMIGKRHWQFYMDHTRSIIRGFNIHSRPLNNQWRIKVFL